MSLATAVGVLGYGEQSDDDGPGRVGEPWPTCSPRDRPTRGGTGLARAVLDGDTALPQMAGYPLDQWRAR